MSDQLKPCPFCGGDAKLSRGGRVNCGGVMDCPACDAFAEPADWNRRAALQIPAGYELMPLEPTPEMLDVAVSFALNVSLSAEYGWSAYMRDVWVRMIAVSLCAQAPK